MLIIEGADNVGKSTLIKQLLEADPSLRLLKRERFKPAQGGTIGLSYLQALCPWDCDYVVHANSLADRFFASECIYGRVHRNGCRMSAAEHALIRLMLRSYGAVIVHCDPGDDAIRETWTDRAQLYDKPLAVAQAYRKQLEDVFSGFRILGYDWTQSHTSVVRRLILERHSAALEAQRRHLAWWGSSGRYGLGTPGAKFMFVGESASTKATTPVPFAHGPAGRYLFEALNEIEATLKQRVVERSYFTNALKPGTNLSGAILREEIEYIQPDAIVSLGRESGKLVASLRPRQRHVVIEHPMYWSRFHHNDRKTYVDLLLHAITPTVPQLPFL
jgi:uracil-DNA glycosylase